MQEDPKTDSKAVSLGARAAAILVVDAVILFLLLTTRKDYRYADGPMRNFTDRDSPLGMTIAVRLSGDVVLGQS